MSWRVGSAVLLAMLLAGAQRTVCFPDYRVRRRTQLCSSLRAQGVECFTRGT